MYRILLIAGSAAAGAVATGVVQKVVGWWWRGEPTLIPFPTLRSPGRTRKGRVGGLQPSNNGPEFLDPERDER